MKERKGIDYVFVWHALSGYWGGVSTDLRYIRNSLLIWIETLIRYETAHTDIKILHYYRDDMTSALSDRNPNNAQDLVRTLFYTSKPQL